MIFNSFGYIQSGFQHFFIFLMKNGYYCISSEKYAKTVLFGLKTHSKKIFLGYFYPPTLPMQRNRVKIVPKQVFTGGALKASPPTQCQFQRPLLVWLRLHQFFIRFNSALEKSKKHSTFIHLLSGIFGGIIFCVMFGGFGIVFWYIVKAEFESNIEITSTRVDIIMMFFYSLHGAYHLTQEFMKYICNQKHK